MSGKSQQGGGTKLVKPRTKAGKRALEKRAPKIVSSGSSTILMHARVGKVKGSQTKSFVSLFEGGGPTKSSISLW